MTIALPPTPPARGGDKPYPSQPPPQWRNIQQVLFMKRRGDVFFMLNYTSTRVKILSIK